MSGEPVRSIPSAQSQRALRFKHVFETNTVDPAGALIGHDAYADSVDVPNSEAAAEWGPAVRALGYTGFTLHIDWTAGAADGFAVRMQISPNGTEWFDYHGADASGALTVKEWSRASAPTGKYAFTYEVDMCPWVRFKVYATGASSAGARARIRVTRHMHGT